MVSILYIHHRKRALLAATSLANDILFQHGILFIILAVSVLYSVKPKTRQHCKAQVSSASSAQTIAIVLAWHLLTMLIHPPLSNHTVCTVWVPSSRWKAPQ
jgi:hypothetical protein